MKQYENTDWIFNIENGYVQKKMEIFILKPQYQFHMKMMEQSLM
ncbi:hypothetical protein [Spiroplasma citri]|nr:hypothetical protein [Spiroplasma citri]